MRHLIVIGMVLWAAATNAQVVGYRCDGTSVFPKSNPPSQFDEATGKNVLWKVPLPNWGHSSPTVIDKKVFVTCEGGWPAGQDFPVLVCYDADTGKELWRRDLNHLPAIHDTVKTAEALKAWQEILARFRLSYTIFHEWTYGDKSAAEKKFSDHGFEWKGWKGGGYGQLRSMGGKYDKAVAKKASMAGLTVETWQHDCGMGLSCFGQSFATPVTDGQSVYVTTAFGGFFAFDLDGKPQWVQFHPGQAGEYCRNGRSPLIYRDLLISDATALARAMDRKTGKLLWSAPVGGETMVTPVIITVGGTDVLICYGMKAFRLPDGRPLEVDGWVDSGATMLVKHDERDLVFFTGGGEHGGWTNKGNSETPPPAAVRFSLSGDILKAKVLWSGVQGKNVSSPTGIVYHAGKLYHANGFVLDAITGEIVMGSTDRKAPRAAPSTRHLLQVAGSHIYGLRETGKGGEGNAAQQATLEVFTLDGKKVAESVMTNAAVEGRKKQQIIEQNGWNTWGWSYSCAYTIAGNRLYIRGNDYLYAIGAK
jgi:outer membrane protein assembly factor BamB